MTNLSNIVSYSDVITNSIAQLLDFPGDKRITNTSSETSSFQLIASLLVNQIKQNKISPTFHEWLSKRASWNVLHKPRYSSNNYSLYKVHLTGIMQVYLHQCIRWMMLSGEHQTPMSMKDCYFCCIWKLEESITWKTEIPVDRTCFQKYAVGCF